MYRPRAYAHSHRVEYCSTRTAAPTSARRAPSSAAAIGVARPFNIARALDDHRTLHSDKMAGGQLRCVPRARALASPRRPARRGAASPASPRRRRATTAPRNRSPHFILPLLLLAARPRDLTRPVRPRPSRLPPSLRSVHITACNIKKLDVKFFNIERCRCWVTVSHGDTSYTTKVGIGLDPEWEETTEFTIADPETDKVEAKFFVKCEKNGNEQQLGDTQARPLPVRRSLVAREKIQIRTRFLARWTLSNFSPRSSVGRRLSRPSRARASVALDEGGLSHPVHPPARRRANPKPP